MFFSSIYYLLSCPEIELHFVICTFELTQYRDHQKIDYCQILPQGAQIKETISEQIVSHKHHIRVLWYLDMR